MNTNLIDERNAALTQVIFKVSQKTDKNTLTGDYLKLLVKEIKKIMISDF